ncbi:589_t:CDS:2, partial [Gigaspora margarita]
MTVKKRSPKNKVDRKNEINKENEAKKKIYNNSNDYFCYDENTKNTSTKNDETNDKIIYSLKKFL